MDLPFCSRHGFAGFRRSHDSLREDSGLSQRPAFDLWRQVGAGTFSRLLSLGLAGIFIRRCSFTLFTIVETMNLCPDTFGRAASDTRL